MHGQQNINSVYVCTNVLMYAYPHVGTCFLYITTACCGAIHKRIHKRIRTYDSLNVALRASDGIMSSGQMTLKHEKGSGHGVIWSAISAFAWDS